MSDIFKEKALTFPNCIFGRCVESVQQLKAVIKAQGREASIKFCLLSIPTPGVCRRGIEQLLGKI